MRPGDAVKVSLIPLKQMRIVTQRHTLKRSTTPASLGYQKATTAIGSGSKNVNERRVIELQKSMPLRVKQLTSPTPK